MRSFAEKAFWATWLLIAAVVVVHTAGAVPLPPAAGASSFAKYVVPAPGAPGNPAKLTLAGSASVSTTPGVGQCLRISCTVDCEYRITSGAGTAIIDDNQLPAATPERLCFDQAHDTISFFSASAGTAYVAVSEP